MRRSSHPAAHLEAPIADADRVRSSDGVADDRAAPRRSRLDRRTVRRAVLAGTLIVVVLVGAYLVPMPSIGRVREWGEGLGPAFIWTFFLAYALVTIAPIPRTTFTVMSGLFFGPAVGFAGAMIASTIAAVAAFVIARRLGRERIQPFLKRPVLRTIEYRLQRRGWLAVGSLRLIAACPFSVTNYCSALSSVRIVPYTVASVIGMAPGTAAVVFLGDALTGSRDPLLLLMSGGFFALGLIGLLLDARLPVRGAAGDTQESSASHQA